MSKLEEELSRTIISMLISDPFFAHLLGSVVRETTEEINDFGVKQTSIGPKLLVNQDFFLRKSLTQQQKIAMVKHETLHIAFMHHCRKSKDMIGSIYDIAADLVVNQYIKDPTKLENPVTLASFPSLNLETDQKLEYYYDKLRPFYREEMELNSTDAKNHPKCKSNRSTTNDLSCRSKKMRSVEDVGIALHKIIQEKRSGCHFYWGVAPPELMYGLENQIIRARERTAVKYWNSIPTQLHFLIAMLIKLHQPQVDWKRQLRIFGASSRRTKVVHTIRRISKRYGTRPGIKVKKFQKLLVAVDTSGSIDQDSLDSFFSEIDSMWRKGAEIEIVECDCTVKRSYPYMGITPKQVSGGGGTSFDPVFEYTRRFQNMHYDGLIYLTDGFADKPRIKPVCKVLWVITPDGTMEYLDFGKAIQISE
jgi:predicted metal-dependent peptidase